MLQMEHWTPEDSPTIIDGHQTHRPFTAGGAACAKPRKPSSGGHKKKMRSGGGGEVKRQRSFEPRAISFLSTSKEEADWQDYVSRVTSLLPRMYPKVRGPFRS